MFQELFSGLSILLLLWFVQNPRLFIVGFCWPLNQNSVTFTGACRHKVQHVFNELSFSWATVKMFIRFFM